MTVALPAFTYQDDVCNSNALVQDNTESVLTVLRLTEPCLHINSGLLMVEMMQKK